MSANDSKRYYWLKLKRDFFKRHDIKIIEAMPNGERYVLFYLKLLAESIDHEGRLRFSDTIPYNEQMISVVTGTDIDSVRSACRLFVELGMMERLDDETLFMTRVSDLIGSETGAAARKRAERGSRKAITDNPDRDNVRDCPQSVHQSKRQSERKEKEEEKSLQPAKRRPLSPLKDPLANHYQGRMTAVHPDTAWSDYAKERSQCGTLAKKTRALLPDTPFDEETALANAILSAFMALKRQGRSDFWRTVSFVPSALSGRWAEVVGALSEKYADKQREADNLEAYRKLRGMT